jgi:hypothetical protein
MPRTQFHVVLNHLLSFTQYHYVLNRYILLTGYPYVLAQIFLSYIISMNSFFVYNNFMYSTIFSFMPFYLMVYIQECYVFNKIIVFLAVLNESHVYYYVLNHKFPIPRLLIIFFIARRLNNQTSSGVSKHNFCSYTNAQSWQGRLEKKKMR